MTINVEICDCKCLSKVTMDELKRGAADLVLNDLKRLKEEKRKKSRSFVKKFAEDVPLLGLTEAVNSRRRRWKVIWAIIFLVCLAATAYCVYQVFEEYMTDPTATKIKMTRQISYPFPPLVLCIDTWLNTEKALQMGLTVEAIHYSLSFLTSYADILEKIHHRSNSSTAKREFEQVYEKYNFTSLSQFFKRITLDAYRDGEGKNKMSFTCDGCLDYVLPKVIMDQNVCYKIRLRDDHGKLREMVEMTIRVPDLNLNMTKSNYWKLYVNPTLTQKVPGNPFSSILQDHTHVVKITSENYLMVNQKKEPCVEKDDPHKSNYSATSCSINCANDYLKALLNCTCFNFETTLINNKLDDYCNTYYMESWEDDNNDIDDSDHAIDFYKCLDNCEPECNVWRYDTDIDLHVSTQLQKETAARKGTEKNVNAAKIIFINNDVLAGGILKFTEVYTYSFETLVGNIGGTAGIWIGASLFTLIQLLAFCSKYCAAQSKKRLPKRKWSRKDKIEEEPAFV